MRKISKYALALACICLLIGCSAKSKGEKAAEEVINCINNYDMEGAKTLIDKYVTTLEDQDLLDFGRVLEEAGIM